MKTIVVDRPKRFRLWMLLGLVALCAGGYKATRPPNIDFPDEVYFGYAVMAIGIVITAFATIFLPTRFTFCSDGMSVHYLLWQSRIRWDEIESIGVKDSEIGKGGAPPVRVLPLVLLLMLLSSDRTIEIRLRSGKTYTADAEADNRAQLLREWRRHRRQELPSHKDRSGNSATGLSNASELPDFTSPEFRPLQVTPVTVWLIGKDKQLVVNPFLQSQSAGGARLQVLEFQQRKDVVAVAISADELRIWLQERGFIEKESPASREWDVAVCEDICVEICQSEPGLVNHVCVAFDLCFAAQLRSPAWQDFINEVCSAWPLNLFDSSENSIVDISEFPRLVCQTGAWRNVFDNAPG